MQTRDLYTEATNILDVAIAVEWNCPFCGKPNTSIITHAQDERECNICSKKVNLKINVELEI